MKSWWLLFLLNVPLLEEVIRKYLIYSDLVFLGADILVLATAVALGVRGKLNLKNLPPTFLVLGALFIALTSINHAISGNHIGIYGIGIRATFLPLVYMLVAARYVSSVEGAYDRIFFCVNVWILVIGIMALAQVILGKNHPINEVWGSTALGVGDFATREKGLLLPGLFRPTSVFTHTGKFGQVIYTLVLFKWSYILLSQGKRAYLSYVLLPFDLAIIFVSGQRAALMFLVIGMLMFAVMYIRQNGVSLKKLLVPPVIILIGLAGAWVISPVMAGAIYDRFESVLSAVPVRLEGNFWLPIKTMLEDYLFSGEGLGSFTFGSRLFGGTIVFETIKMQGLGESSLIRLCGEVGVVATIVIVIAYLSLVTKGLKVSETLKGSPIASASLFFSIWVICLLFWSNTADVFGNSVVMSLGYALSGAILYEAHV